MNPSWRCDVAIVGGGIVGLSAALVAGQAGARVVLVDRGPTWQNDGIPDGRTAALLNPAIKLLDQWGLWQALRGCAAPLEALRIVQPGDGRLSHADVTFRAEEVGAACFGYNIPNDALCHRLCAAVSALDGVVLLGARTVRSISADGDDALLTLDDDRQVTAKLAIAADGRHSAVRKELGIKTRVHAYGQHAIVCSFDHERPHAATSIELHRPGGPFTMVPLLGQRSSLVWVEPDEKAHALMSLSESAFLDALDMQASPWLGHVSNLSARRSYPLSGVLAGVLTAPRTMLIGEAAHALSPIGAQGLNLSLQDVAVMGDLIHQALLSNHDPGSASVLATYRRKRMPDIKARFLAIDGLNRMVASGWPPMGMARAVGLQTLSRLPFVRKRLMQAMMQPLALPDAIARIAA